MSAFVTNGYAPSPASQTSAKWTLGLAIAALALVLALVLGGAMTQGSTALVIALCAAAGLACVPLATWFPGLYEQSVLFLIAFTLPLTLVILKKHFLFREEPHYGGSIGLQITATDLLMALLLLGVWLGAVAKPEGRRLDPAILKAFALYYVLVIPSAIFGHDLELGLFELISLLQTFAFFIFMLYFLSTFRRVRAFACGLLVSLVLQSVVTIIQERRPGTLDQFTPGAQEADNARVVNGRLALPDMDAGTTFIDGELQIRPSGLIAHPNLLAMYLALIMPVAFSVWVAGPAFLRWIATIALPLSMAAMYFTLSRSGALGLVAGMVIATWISMKWKILRLSFFQKAAVIIVLLVAGAGIARQAGKIYLRLTETADEAIDYRRNLSVAALKMAAAHPFFGVGLNSFDTVVVAYDSSQTSKYKRLPVHNILMLELGETGFFGLTAFLILWTVVLRLIFRAARQCQGRSQKLLAVFSGCGVIAFFVADLSNPVFRTPTFTAMIWAQVALSLSISRIQIHTKPVRRLEEGRDPRTFGGTVACTS